MQVKDGIDKVIDLIVSDGVDVAKNYAKNTTVMIFDSDGKSHIETIEQIMLKNSEKRNR